MFIDIPKKEETETVRPMNNPIALVRYTTQHTSAGC